MGTNYSVEKDFTDMTWSCCDECGCVQLKSLINPDILYKEPHNPAIGKVWEKHNEQFSNLITEYKYTKILEIGGANLKMANLINKKADIFSYDIIDFSSNEYSTNKIDDKIRLIKSSVENYALQNKVESIIMSHTFEHIYEPVIILNKLSNCLENDGRIFISVPNIKNQLADGFLNALNFEHTFFIDHEYINLIANNAGFCIEKIIEFSSYNSFYVLKKIIDKNKNLKHTKIKNAKNIFLSFVDKLNKDVKQIREKTKNNKIYVFGAHIFSQFLINFGLDEEKIICLLDNDPCKIDKYLFGTNLVVKNPIILKDIEKPYVLLRAAQYKDEIEHQLNCINKNIVYI
jgi:SAM-dependent methyltransferase